MKIFFIIVRYWTESDSSNPHSFGDRGDQLRFAFLPAIRCAGSRLGITLKIRKTITETAKRTKSHPDQPADDEAAHQIAIPSGSAIPAWAST